MTKSTAYLCSQSPITFWENLLKLCKGVRKNENLIRLRECRSKVLEYKKKKFKKKKIPKRETKVRLLNM